MTALYRKLGQSRNRVGAEHRDCAPIVPSPITHACAARQRVATRGDDTCCICLVYKCVVYARSCHLCLVYLCASAIGFAWIVIRFSLISVVGRFFGVTGTFSIWSSVESAPSMTLAVSVITERQRVSYSLAKYRVFAVQRRLLGVSDEELSNQHVEHVLRRSHE